MSQSAEKVKLLLDMIQHCGDELYAMADSATFAEKQLKAIKSNPDEQLNAIGRNQDAIQTQSSDNCPHCGGEPKKGTSLKPSTNKILYHAVCNDCGARTTDCDTMDEAWAKWRARA